MNFGHQICFDIRHLPIAIGQGYLDFWFWLPARQMAGGRLCCAVNFLWFLQDYAMKKNVTTIATNNAIYKSEKTKRLKIGIIGAGLMGRWHAYVARRTGAHIVAIVDTNIETARRLADKYPGAKSLSSLKETMEHIELDVLHICTPLDTHLGIAEIAIDAGINLLIEKPIAPMAEDTAHLFHKAADRGVIICPVHQFIFQDGVQKVRKLIHRISSLVHIESTICSAGGVGFSASQQDLIAADILSHPLSLMQFFLPGDIPCENWTTNRPNYGELRAFNQNSGISLSVFISMNARPTECSFKLSGTDGTIHIDLFHGFSFVEPGKVSKTRKVIHPFDLSIRRLLAATTNIGRRIIRWEPAYPGLQRLIRLFYQAVRQETELPISQEDTITVARIRDILIHNSSAR